VAWAVGAVGRWAGIVDAAAAPVARPAAGNALGCTALIIASYAFARLAWRRWDDIEMRDVVGHFEPEGGAIALIIAIALQMVASLGIAVRSSTAVTTAGLILLIGLSFSVPFLTPKLPASRRPRPADSGRRSNTDLAIALLKTVVIPIFALLALFQGMRDMLGGLRRLVDWILPVHPSTSLKALLIGVGTVVGLMLLSALINFVNWLRRPRVR
jgi:hypothetical protein